MRVSAEAEDGGSKLDAINWLSALAAGWLIILGSKATKIQKALALEGTYEAAKQAIQDLIAPELERIKGQMSALDAKTEALDAKLDAKIGALDSKLDNKIATVEAKIDALDIKFGALDTKVEAARSEIHSLEKRLDETLSIRERLAALETTVRSGQHP